MHEQLAELSQFNFPKIYMLSNFIADMTEFGSLGMRTTDNSKRMIENVNLAYSMPNKVFALRRILKYQIARTNSRHGSWTVEYL